MYINGKNGTWKGQKKKKEKKCSKIIEACVKKLIWWRG